MLTGPGSAFSTARDLVLYVTYLASRIERGADFLLKTAATGDLRGMNVSVFERVCWRRRGQCFFSVVPIAVNSCVPLALTYLHPQIPQDNLNQIHAGVTKLRLLMRGPGTNTLLHVLKGWMTDVNAIIASQRRKTDCGCANARIEKKGDEEDSSDDEDDSNSDKCTVYYDAHTHTHTHTHTLSLSLSHTEHTHTHAAHSLASRDDGRQREACVQYPGTPFVALRDGAAFRAERTDLCRLCGRRHLPDHQAHLESGPCRPLSVRAKALLRVVPLV
jgi:hypothetical protein